MVGDSNTVVNDFHITKGTATCYNSSSVHINRFKAVKNLTEKEKKQAKIVANEKHNRKNWNDKTEDNSIKTPIIQKVKIRIRNAL